jgi:hypothetical protein
MAKGIARSGGKVIGRKSAAWTDESTSVLRRLVKARYAQLYPVTATKKARAVQTAAFTSITADLNAETNLDFLVNQVCNKVDYCKRAALDEWTLETA